MGDKSPIEWTDATWNPTTGCTKVSAGCKNCYAERLAPKVFAGQMTVDRVTLFRRKRKFEDVRCHEDRLDQPLHWRRPRRIFVNSMSDLFHEDIPDEFIDRVFAVMGLAGEHTFQVLTKRAERMRAYCKTLGRHSSIDRVSLASREFDPDGSFMWGLGANGWHLPNVWLGVSVENQHFADARIPLLLATPAAVRFISYEPALGPVDLRTLSLPGGLELDGLTGCHSGSARHLPLPPRLPGLDWIIVGGESGPGARPFDLAWARGILEQRRVLNTPVFVKQLGRHPLQLVMYGPATFDADQPVHAESLRLSNLKGGDPSEWPEDLRVREYPTAKGG